MGAVQHRTCPSAPCFGMRLSPPVHAAPMPAPNPDSQPAPVPQTSHRTAPARGKEVHQKTARDPTSSSSSPRVLAAAACIPIFPKDISPPPPKQRACSYAATAALAADDACCGADQGRRARRTGGAGAAGEALRLLRPQRAARPPGVRQPGLDAAPRPACRLGRGARRSCTLLRSTSSSISPPLTSFFVTGFSCGSPSPPLQVPLNSELDILDARLHELDPVVDHVCGASRECCAHCFVVVVLSASPLPSSSPAQCPSLSLSRRHTRSRARESRCTTTKTRSALQPSTARLSMSSCRILRRQPASLTFRCGSRCNQSHRRPASTQPHCPL